MKNSIIIISAFIWALIPAIPLLAGPQNFHSIIARKNAGGGGDIPAGALLSEDWTGAGPASGWTFLNNADDDYSTGDRAGGDGDVLELNGTASNAKADKSFTANDDVSGFFDYEFTTLPGSSNDTMNVRNGATDLATLILQSTGKLRARATGGTAADSTATFSVNTHYRIWWEYKVGAGTDAEFRFWVSTTDTKPGSHDAECVNGTSTSQANSFEMQGISGNAIHYFDRIRVDTP